MKEDIRSNVLWIGILYLLLTQNEALARDVSTIANNAQKDILTITRAIAGGAVGITGGLYLLGARSAVEHLKSVTTGAVVAAGGATVIDMMMKW